MHDPFGRHITYLRLSLTDRCDLRCFYCLPRDHRDFRSPPDWLNPLELARLVGQFARLGIRHVRLTGGEPLVRKEVVEISRAVGRVPGIDELSLSTNATRLDRFAPQLREAGISRINISLDSLDADTFRRITGGDVGKVLAGIDAAVAAGFAPIKLNMVVMRGINDHEVDAMVAYCMDKGLALRFIETMPIGQGGRAATEHYIGLDEIERRLAQVYRLRPAALRGSGPARYFQIDDSPSVIGFITPQSQHFCDSCNRVRLAVNGDLHLCLGQEDRVPLGAMLRAGASDAELGAAIVAGIARKPERHEFGEKPEQIVYPMSSLGG